VKIDLWWKSFSLTLYSPKRKISLALASDPSSQLFDCTAYLPSDCWESHASHPAVQIGINAYFWCNRLHGVSAELYSYDNRATWIIFIVI